MIWAQVKGYVAANNKTFKLGDVRLLLEKGIQNVTPERWEKCVQHVIKEEDKMWNLDVGWLNGNCYGTINYKFTKFL
jgi:hypothetical protein